MRPLQRNLGSRCLCSSCDTKYYDLGKGNPSCPRCGAPAYSEDSNPRATAMARIKAEGPRKRSADEEELPFGLGKSPETEEEEEEEELEELGELTEETSTQSDYDYE
jgi:hypothetical protein